MNFHSVSDFVHKEQQLTVQLESEQFWSSLENTDGFCPSVIPFIIDMMNNVNKFTDRFISSVISLVNPDTSSFFCFVLNFFSHRNSLGIYRWNISVGKIPENLPTEIFPRYFRLYLSVFW
jgi:hypothetical protein